MFSTLIGKKKMTEDALANTLVEGTLKTSSLVFGEVVDYLNDCPHFDRSPELNQDNDLDFIITVFTCNISRITQHLENGQDKRVAQAILKKLAYALYLDVRELSQRVSACKAMMKRLNHPSKNLIYAMPKAVFEFYDLNRFQQEYFRELNSPNPLYLKEMNSLMAYLVWDWDFFKDEYRITK